MPGVVKVDLFRHPHLQLTDLVARTCACSGRYGEICSRLDVHSSELRVCPYWYGVRITEEGYRQGEARSLAEARSWLASEGLYSLRRYEVLCLQAASDLEPGAARSR